jgi:predicted dehydrogenase
MFKDRLQESLQNLTKYGEKSAVPADRQFVGWDAYKKVLASDINYVILATPPAFRAMHLRAAVEAGKNIFTEKPVGVDPAADQDVLRDGGDGQAEGLAIVAGTQRRHHAAYLATIKRVQDGAIGDVVSMRVFWNQGGLWTKPRQAEWTDMEWQLRNWLYFTWLSGDHIVEQHVHNLDVANWIMGGKPPVRVFGVGGRQARTAPEYGHIYDHFGLDYEYENGHVLSMCRQQPGTPGPRRRVRLRHQGHVRHAGRRPLRDQGAERVEVDGRVHEPVRPGAHGPHREHPRRQPAERAAASVREHADGDRRTRSGLHGQGRRARSAPATRRSA